MNDLDEHGGLSILRSSSICVFEKIDNKQEQCFPLIPQEQIIDESLDKV